MLKRAVGLLMMLAVAWSFCADISASEHDGESGSEWDALGKNEDVIERMIQGFEDHEEVLDISEYEVYPEEVGRLFADATKNSPYLFYVENDLSYTYRKGGTVVSLLPRYECSREEADARIAFCKSEIEKLALVALAGGSDFERARYAHDLICMRYKYDLTLESNDLYSFLKTGEGTCQGYTWAYMALLREVGIECEYVASDDIKHIWLKLKLDGEWYHSDVTWDDPPSGEGKGESVSLRHFLFSDVKADEDGYFGRYSGGGQTCTDTKYDGSETLSYHAYGDIDHSKRADICDLITLLRYVELGKNTGLCFLCADISRDLQIDEGDIDAMRTLLLKQP